ncbi:MAG: Hsp70 suppressor, GTPase facilitates ribosomal subunit dissociation [Caeruleum heppii]|nr:MAG: Hsp70 suppressor, GTPase facilitates ribosomal subunit dissociation [Caeruleum heppii]
MSRHRIVKNLDLDEELDDFDGGDDYDDDEGTGDAMDEAEKAKMRDCVSQVRQRLEIDAPQIADKDIEDSLWHYYYDVDKTLAWLKKQHLGKGTEKNKKSGHAPAVSNGTRNKQNAFRTSVPQSSQPCPGFSVEDFFRDTPWLNVPLHRRSEILIEPLYPHGGLLGGSSTATGPPKVSKLAALAAARRKKEENKAATLADENTKPRNHQTPLKRISSKHNGQPESPIKLGDSPVGTSQVDGNPAKDPHSREDTRSSKKSAVKDVWATPSEFAKTMLGTHGHGPPHQSTNVAASALGGIDSDILPMAESNAFAGPSPDDIVIAAQSNKGRKGVKPAPQQAENGAGKQVTNGIQSLSLSEASKVKSKNLDVLEEFNKDKGKAAANFVVIGHVDHGKSTLMGRLLVDLQVVQSRTLEKYRKEAENIGKSSFALAWVLDQTTEERNRGVTMDIATNKFETEKTKFTILDAPGHRDFIPNMIAGASQADFAVLVIDGGPNAFESGLKGQTKEHALLVRSMGVQRLIVAVNKLDTIEWSKDRFEEIQQQTTAFLTIAGFQTKNLRFVPCSGLTGENVARPVKDPKASWYTGSTLVELLDESEPAARALEKPLRLTISDIFRGGVQNPLSISGRVDAGSLQVGDVVLAMPSGEKASIKGVELDEESRDWAVAGQIVTLHLTDIDAVHLKPGDVLSSPTSPISCPTTLTVKLLAFDHLLPQPIELHRGRLHAPARISELIATLEKSTGEVLKKRPKVVKPGHVVRVRVVIEVEGGVPLEVGDRVVLRAGGETVGAGLVE